MSEEKNIKNTNGKTEETQGESHNGLALGLCFGTALGMMFGQFVLHNMALGLCFGPAFGMCLGTAYDAANHKDNTKKADQETEQEQNEKTNESGE